MNIYWNWVLASFYRMTNISQLVYGRGESRVLSWLLNSQSRILHSVSASILPSGLFCVTFCVGGKKALLQSYIKMIKSWVIMFLFYLSFSCNESRCCYPFDRGISWYRTSAYWIGRSIVSYLLTDFAEVGHGSFLLTAADDEHRPSSEWTKLHSWTVHAGVWQAIVSQALCKKWNE